jgi:hypothetical protein
VEEFVEEEFVECGLHAAIKVETSSAADAVIVRVTIIFIVELQAKLKFLRKLGSARKSRNQKMHRAAVLSRNGSPPLQKSLAR